MKLEYPIEQEDFLIFQLYTASQSEMIQKKKRKGWIGATVLFAATSIFFVVQENYPSAIYFGICTLLFGFLYPIYFSWRYKRHYNKYIAEHYQNRFGIPVILEINEEEIFSQDKAGESRFKLSEIEQVNEIGEYFFVKISTGASLIIPKDGVGDADSVRNEFERLGLKLNQMLDWKW